MNERIFSNQKGQGLTEYLILLMLISIACIAAVSSVGSTVKSKLQAARKQINEEVSLEKALGK